jgi:two-component sensor histidine kinase/PAS domain-containing protein
MRWSMSVQTGDQAGVGANGDGRHASDRPGASRAQPVSEPLRLMVLGRYGAVNTPREAIFDGLVAIAADGLDAPIALVTLVDEQRSWLKAQVGLGEPATHCDASFCREAINHPEDVLVVPDALADPRFAAAPMVAGGPRIRFYAAAPLRARGGHVMGTLAVASPMARPGGLSGREERHLRAVAASVMDALDLRRRGLVARRAEKIAQAHRTHEERLRLALKAAGACAWELDPATGETTWDASALPLLGVPGTAGLHDALALHIHPADLPGVLRAIEAALEPTGPGRYMVEHRAKAKVAAWGDADQAPGPRWFQSQGQAWFEGEGEARHAVRLVSITLDITERHAAAERQALLVSELNHRVKNTLSIVQAIAEQTRRSTGRSRGQQRGLDAPERRQFHVDFNARLRALASAHDALTREAWRGAALDELVWSLVRPFASEASRSHAAPGPQERVTVGGPPIWLAPDTAVALALVIHELATNAAKHGALASSEGRVTVSWGRDDAAAAVWLHWAEAGGAHVPGPPARTGFGSRLVDTTVRRQLGGSLQWDWQPGGLAVRLAVPAARALAQR